MDLALWLVAGWLGLSVVVLLWVVSAIRGDRTGFELVAIPIRGTDVRRPGRGALPR